jgi:hypothetical protein
VTALNPEQWRILNYLYQHKLHTARPKLNHVRKSQKASDADLVDLIARGMVTPMLGGEEINGRLGKLPRLLQTALAAHIRLWLPAAGLYTVLEDAGNQIRYTLSRHRGPIRLTQLFDGNNVTLDDVAAEEAAGRCRLSLVIPDFGEFAMDASALWLFYNTDRNGMYFTTALTPKGTEYLPN